MAQADACARWGEVVYEDKNITTKDIKTVEDGYTKKHYKKYGKVPRGNPAHKKNTNNMTFGLTSFTFDPNNRVNISYELTKSLKKFVQDEVFTSNMKLSELKPEWKLVYIISSDKTFETLKVREGVKKSNKYKDIDHYVYFPRIEGLGDTAPYPIEEFLEYFFEGLGIILRDFYNVEVVNLNELKDKAKRRFIGKKKYAYHDDGTHLTTEEIRELLGR